jgi:NAD(P)-dependent dehydrogenase (short-subunit alcohol dehydrogenase family)
VAGSGVYNATKWAVAGFSDSVRQEMAKQRVRVSLVQPGVVATELASYSRPEVMAKPNPDFMGFEFLQRTTWLMRSPTSSPGRSRWRFRSCSSGRLSRYHNYAKGIWTF